MEQQQNNDTILRPTVSGTHCIVGKENYTGVAVICIYDFDKHSQA